MSEVVNGTQYVGQEPAKDGFFTHQETIDGDYTIESAVVAGPITMTGTVTVTGTLVVV